ncbi:MAG: helix-turn-helix transcriptional regulator, partial [Ruminococcaceae bacterium]|nr:helix-turn-helix transcriptional regulator [Oscillospiraceae bacterium]
MSFSENLKQIRKEHHLSQEELAELLDVSRQAVSKWEQGMGYPEVE